MAEILHNAYPEPTGRGHDLKSRPDLFQAILEGRKRHELRDCHDRDFAVGDNLHLREHIPSEGYTGRELDAIVLYITSADYPCALSGNALNPSYCILSIQVIGPNP
jgi:Domain of unknown function (DUF3850)